MKRLMCASVLIACLIVTGCISSKAVDDGYTLLFIWKDIGAIAELNSATGEAKAMVGGSGGALMCVPKDESTFVRSGTHGQSLMTDGAGLESNLIFATGEAATEIAKEWSDK